MLCELLSTINKIIKQQSPCFAQTSSLPQFTTTAAVEYFLQHAMYSYPCSVTYLGSRFAMISSASSGNGGGVEDEEDDEAAGESATENVTKSLVSSTVLGVAFRTVPFDSTASPRDAPWLVLLAVSASAFGGAPEGEGVAAPPLPLLLVPVCGCTGAGGWGITYEVIFVEAAAAPAATPAATPVVSSVGWNVGANFALEEAPNISYIVMWIRIVIQGMKYSSLVDNKRARGREIN